MRFALSLFILTLIIVVVIAPFMPGIRAFFTRKTKELDLQFGWDQDEQDRL